MSTGDTILRLTGLIYDAALNPDRWSPFLEELAEELDAHLVNITFVDRREYRPSIAVHVRFDPDALQQYTAHYAHIDPWAAAAHIKGLWREGVVELGESLISRSDLMKSAFWNEFGNRFGFQSGMSAVFASAGCQVAVLSAAPRPESPPFGQCTRSLVSALVPHLDRALQIHSRLAASLRCQAALVDVIDQLSMGVVVFDGDGRVVIQNRAATEMFRVRDGLSIDKGAVRAAGRHDDRKLQSLIADALGVASGKVPQGRAITNISRPSLRRPYEVLVSPLKLPAQEPFSQSAAAVMILVDPGTIAATDAEQLAHLYDFTPAEGRLAVTLLRELTVAEAADELHISVNTARTHLKRAFEKTGTRRQSELMQRLATGLAVVRRR